MTTGRRITYVFLAALAAAVIGWLAGGFVHDAVQSDYDIAVAVVSSGAELASPGPVESTSVGTPTPVVTATATAEPEETEKPHILCGPKPKGEGKVECRLRGGDWVWVKD